LSRTRKFAKEKKKGNAVGELPSEKGNEGKAREDCLESYGKVETEQMRCKKKRKGVDDISPLPAKGQKKVNEVKARISDPQFIVGGERGWEQELW